MYYALQLPCSGHVERLHSDWIVNGRSVLERAADEDDDTTTFFAQRRISLSNFKRFSEPSSKHDEGAHLFERSTKSSGAFRAQLVQGGRLTSEEDRELQYLERNMDAVHPILDGILFLGR